MSLSGGEFDVASSEDLLRSILGNLPNSILFALDREYRYLAFNDNHRAAMLAAWKSTIRLGYSILDYMSTGSLRALTKASIDRTLAGESFIERQEQAGADTVLELHWQPIFGENMLIIGALSFAADLGELQRAIQKAEKLELELDRLMVDHGALLAARTKELESFASSLSHDLKAPLRAITGFSSIVLEDYGPALDGEGQRKLAIISENALKMNALITDLVTITRIGSAALHPVLISMRDMARAMYHEAASPEERSAIAFELGDIPDCIGDPTLLRKVWGNLLANAIKFSAGRPGRSIEVFADASASEIKYGIRDNGVGFNDRYAHKLFKLFSRLHSCMEYAGTGAGLAIVRRIVERHGGRVGAGILKDQRTEFWFTLPRTEASGLELP